MSCGISVEEKNVYCGDLLVSKFMTSYCIQYQNILMQLLCAPHDNRELFIHQSEVNIGTLNVTGLHLKMNFMYHRSSNQLWIVNFIAVPSLLSIWNDDFFLEDNLIVPLFCIYMEKDKGKLKRKLGSNHWTPMV